jgi:hypothetical protein
MTRHCLVQSRLQLAEPQPDRSAERWCKGLCGKKTKAFWKVLEAGEKKKLCGVLLLLGKLLNWPKL